MSQQQTTGRQALRTQTTFCAKLTCEGASSRGLVKDLSHTGLCFQFYIDINARAGKEVSIESTEFGHLTGTVRWWRGDRVGVKLEESSNTAAQIASYYKHFWKPEREVKLPVKL